MYSISPRFLLTNSTDLSLRFLFDHPWEETVTQNSPEHFNNIYALMLDRLQALKDKPDPLSKLERTELLFIFESLLEVKDAMHAEDATHPDPAK